MTDIATKKERGLHQLFEVGVVLKGLNAAVELVLGVLLLFVNVGGIIQALAQHELLDDPQAHAAGCFVDTPMPDGTTGPTPSTPVDFSSDVCAPRSPSPEFGQHTEEVLLDLGYDWDRIIALKESGSIL